MVALINTITMAVLERTRDIALVFPAAYAGIALVGTVILALVVMLAPLRRAVRLNPGEALRYA